ncbi:MAG: Protein-arginine kinase activator protein [Chlamydiae bacterium]|nr:Protein-arginine kinase activator protein [Chlamydiota bacterium]
MPDRPVECGQCKKPAKVLYKEIVGDTITVTEMCADCPILLQKLHGTAPEIPAPGKEPTGAGLYCGNCHTPLEAIKMGNPFGCSQCYMVFGDALVQELLAENKIPKAMENAKRNQPLHIGKTPDKPAHIPSSNRLPALNEALNEALQKENYEEAAWLRDQIKELTEKPDEQQT